MADDPRLRFDVLSTRDQYTKQSERLTLILTVLSRFNGAIMGFVAVFGALDTMYATMSGRAREIATMRAIGFPGLPVVMAVMLETMLLAIVDGVPGGALAWVLFNG